jgi:hypothetical protein
MPRPTRSASNAANIALVPRAVRLVLAALAAGACGAGVLHGAQGAADGDLSPTEHVLLGAPDRHAPTQRSTYVDDPQGQIERIAAIGHLVAWSVRTPADPLRKDDADVEAESPLSLPERSTVVVVDERGGEPLRLDLGRRWVSRLRMMRGPGGDVEPQLAVESCVDRGAHHCTAQLVTLSAGPLRMVRRSTDPSVIAAVAGLIDGGRRVIVGRQRGHAGGAGGCAPRLSIAGLDGLGRRLLPAVQFDGGLYTHCTGFGHAELHGRYAFAWIDGKAGGKDLGGIAGTTVAALDVDAGPRARWRAVQWPYRYSDGSTGLEIGPAVTHSAMYWEELDDEGTSSLELVALPRDLLHAPRDGKTPTTADPITPKATTACDLAATTDAIYELTNARCRAWPDFGGPIGGAIHRITNPVFRPDDG